MSAAVQAQADYALGQHVFLCVCGRDLVLLDLARDLYLAIEAPGTVGLDTRVRGWPVVSRADAHAAAPNPCESILAGLLQRGLLTRDAAGGKDAAPLELIAPSEEITADMFGERPRIRATEAAAFIAACVTGHLLRKRRSIEHIVERTKRRRDRVALVANGLDLDTARRLMAVFGSMRSMFLSTRELCLLESIVLLELLARYRLFPRWVFGVRTRPFAAHCWLQQGHVVLNDTIERVSRYTPIMAT
jgi:hypothetical protein